MGHRTGLIVGIVALVCLVALDGPESGVSNNATRGADSVASSAWTPQAAPAKSPRRWFSARSPLNTPIPSGAAADPNSAAMVAGLAHVAESRGLAVAVKRWTVPVYYANAKTPRQDVRLTAPWRSRNQMLRVPIPPEARPDPGSSGDTDGHMTVIDWRAGCFFEFFEAVRHEDGSWEAMWANRGLLSGTGIQPGGASTRASGFVNFAGLIRPTELGAGVIRHALTFGYPFTKNGGPVAPATASDGRASTQDGWGGLARPPNALPIPEGARAQLDPSLDLDVLDLLPWQKTVARALQVYGMFLADTSPNISLAAVGAQSWRSNPYVGSWGDEAYAYLPASLAQHLRVLRLPPQARRRNFVAPSRCAVMR